MNVIVNFDKPQGITSQDAVIKVRKIFGMKKAGHAGTLDPLATGVLLVCLGEATKASRFLMDMEKEYVAEMKLGERTDTFDSEGEVIETASVPEITHEILEEALVPFRGKIMQMPPMYSALKHKGTPLYKLARKGVEVQREEREVNIYHLEVQERALPDLRLRVRCSRGTYIRSLVDDIGSALGTVAHMTGLRRTAVGSFRVEAAASLEALGEGAPQALSTLDEALVHLEAVNMREEDYLRAKHGGATKAVDYGLYGDSRFLRLKGPDGALFAIGRLESDKIRIERMLHLGVKA